jgi:hypothetical protein
MSTRFGHDRLPRMRCSCGLRGKGGTDRRVGVSQLFSTSLADSDSLFCDVSLLRSLAGSGIARIVPWVGAPHSGHDSDFFDVISAPQHPQNAAMVSASAVSLFDEFRATNDSPQYRADSAHFVTVVSFQAQLRMNPKLTFCPSAASKNPSVAPAPQTRADDRQTGSYRTELRDGLPPNSPPARSIRLPRHISMGEDIVLPRILGRSTN